MTEIHPTLLVLAASTYQLDAIRTARRLGFRIVTLDNVPSNPGHALADRSYNVDTTDLDGVLRVAQAERIAGVLAACTDVAVPTAAYVAQNLGLPGIPLAGARVLTSKLQFRQFLHQQHLPAPRALKAGPGQTAGADWSGGRRWILKPDRSSGSKGIFIVRSEEEFRERLPQALAFSPNQAAVLEEFIDGRQGTCEGVLCGGKVALAFVLDRQTPEPPYVTTLGHCFPSTLSTAIQRRLLALLEQVFQSLDIRDGVFDCDFVAAADEVYLLEVAARPGGNSISGLLRRATGFDFMEYAVKHACRLGAALPSRLSARVAGVLLLGVWQDGKLQYDRPALESLLKESWVDSLSIDLPMGTMVHPFINGRHRVGEAFIGGKDRSELERNAAELRRRLELRVEKLGNAEPLETMNATCCKEAR